MLHFVILQKKLFSSKHLPAQSQQWKYQKTNLFKFNNKELITITRTTNITQYSAVSIVDFKQVNNRWEYFLRLSLVLLQHYKEKRIFFRNNFYYIETTQRIFT